MRCSDLEGWIVDYIDGNIAKRLRREMDDHLKECAECRKTLFQERAVSSRLRELPRLECPKRVEDRIFTLTENEHASFFSMFKKRIAEQPGWRSRFAAFVLTAMLIIVFGVFFDSHEDSRQKVEFTAEEIEMATRDVELALSYVGYYAKRTEDVLVDQIVSKPIAGPLKSTVKKAFQPLMNGDKS